MSLAELRCELIADDDKPSFQLVHGGVTYRGSAASQAEAQVLITKIVNAQRTINEKQLGSLKTASGMARGTMIHA